MASRWITSVGAVKAESSDATEWSVRPARACVFVDLVDKAVVRILDLVFVRKEVDAPPVIGLPASSEPSSQSTAT
jgi:hypothetical protein